MGGYVYVLRFSPLYTTGRLHQHSAIVAENGETVYIRSWLLSFVSLVTIVRVIKPLCDDEH